MRAPRLRETIYSASSNAGKLRDFAAAASVFGVEIQVLPGLAEIPAPAEDGATFEANARLKAEAYSRARPGLLVLADDSGLEVDALNGAPGVHSARFAALDQNENSPDAANNAKLLKLLKDVPVEKRVARFRCVIALVPVSEPKIEGASPVCYADESEVQTFDGTCEGHIQFVPAGGGGFGYDPLFVPNGFRQSFAELGEDAKKGLSHRGKALGRLKEFFGGVKK